MINWQKSKRKWNSLRMPVNRKGLPDGLMQRFLMDVETHQGYKTKWPSRQFSWKLARSRHLCFGVTWPRFRENCRKDYRVDEGKTSIELDRGCLPFDKKTRLVDRCGKWKASKPEWEFPYGICCSIYSSKRSNPKGLGLVRKSEWNAQFPFGNSV